ncbi:MAG: response regulator [Sulfuricaulis sp.]
MNNNSESWLEGLRILVADDDELIRNLLVRILTKANHRPHAIQRGSDVLSEITGGRYDLAILDVHMPGVGAVEIAKQYRNSGERRTPIIALTADITLETETKCRVAGIDTLLTKPVHRKELLLAIDRVMAGNHIRGTAVPDNGDKDSCLDESQLADLEKLGSSNEFAKAIVEKFLTHAFETAAQIEHAVRENHWQTARELAHKLSGCAGTVGASGVKEVCNRLYAASSLNAQSVSELRPAITTVASLLKDKYDLKITL